MKCKILSIVLLLWLLILPVSAAQQGSLLINNVNASVTCYPVADKTGVLTADFAQSGVTELSEQADIARQLKIYAQEHQLTGQTLTPNDAHEVLFTSMDEGWYLICSNISPGEFAPFLMQIPTRIGENVIYHVQATPKEETPQQTQPGGSDEVEPNIPQTGHIQWPKYLLLALGGLCVLMGAGMVMLGREKRYE